MGGWLGIRFISIVREFMGLWYSSFILLLFVVILNISIRFFIVFWSW